MNLFTSQILKSLLITASCRVLCWLSIAWGIQNSTPVFAETGIAEATTTFLVVRHAERDGAMDKLTTSGEERSKILALLGNALRVEVIYSTDTKRTRATALPLSQVTKAQIQLYRLPTKEWITKLKKEHVGRVVLIVGHSNTAGVIAGLLANREPFEIAHDEYDALFVIKTSNSKTQSMRLLQDAGDHELSSVFTILANWRWCLARAQVSLGCPEVYS